MKSFIITVILAITDTFFLSRLIPLEDSKACKVFDAVLLIVIWVCVIVSWFMVR